MGEEGSAQACLKGWIWVCLLFKDLLVHVHRGFHSHSTYRLCDHDAYRLSRAWGPSVTRQFIWMLMSHEWAWDPEAPTLPKNSLPLRGITQAGKIKNGWVRGISPENAIEWCGLMSQVRLFSYPNDRETRKGRFLKLPHYQVCGSSVQEKKDGLPRYCDFYLWFPGRDDSGWVKRAQASSGIQDQT